MIDNEFCGKDLHVPHSDFIPKSKNWDSITILGGLTRKDIVLPQSYLEEKRNFFFHAAYTEFDAENFCRHLDTLNNNFSPEFMAFEKLWRKDEQNHYIGFRYIYSIMFDQSIEDVARSIEDRPYDFSRLAAFFKDEFIICVLIAFDEILTTKGYIGEQKLYQSFGNLAFLKWFKTVTRDEVYHFKNIMEVIRIRHFNRIDEIPKILESFINWDIQENEYTGTFVLDHDLYSRDLLQHGASMIKTYFK